MFENFFEYFTNSRLRWSSACFPVGPGMNADTSVTQSNSFLMALAISLASNALHYLTLKKKNWREMLILDCFQEGLPVSDLVRNAAKNSFQRCWLLVQLLESVFSSRQTVLGSCKETRSTLHLTVFLNMVHSNNSFSTDEFENSSTPTKGLGGFNGQQIVLEKCMF